MWDLTSGISRSVDNRQYHVTLDHPVKQDLKVWLMFLNNLNGISLLYEQHWLTNHSLDLYTDASKLCYGCKFGDKWFYGPWDTVLKEYHINVLELVPIVMAFCLFQHQLSKCNIVIHTDNMPLGFTINQQSSKCKLIMSLVRKLVVTALTHDINLMAVSYRLSTILSPYQISR